MRGCITIGTALLLALCMPSFAGAANITVDWAGGGDHVTIQAGINAAVDGADTVWITDGTYMVAGNVNLDFYGKAITVRSVSDDPTTCIINCNSAQRTRGFHFHNSETSASIVRSLTIQNGQENWNWPHNFGGAINCNSSSPTITNCIFSGNEAIGGGAICCYDSSSPTIINCTISGNEAADGSGIYCLNSSPTITNCTISGNSARQYGGGIFCNNNSFPTVTNCTISGNSAVDYGGGIYCNDSSSPTIMNCTISGNSATQYGGGIYCDSSSPSITNCILWGDSAPVGDEIHVFSGSPTADYCDIEGGCPSGVTCTNCINQDPLFVGGSPFDYHLTACSPCIDTGTSSGAPSDDIDGDGRPVGDGTEIGADEYKYVMACGDSQNDADTAGLADKLNAGSCGYAGADVLYKLDTSTLSSGDIIIAALSDEQTVNFYISILNGCDPDANCLDSHTTTAQTAWNGSDEIYIAVDGGEGTFDLDVACAAPTATPTNTPTSTPTNTPTNTPTDTPTPTNTPTDTPTDTPTNTPTSTPTSTNTPTDTPIPNTATSVPTNTLTPTDTPVPSTATGTPGGPTATPLPIPSQGGMSVMLMVLLMTISLIAILGRRVKN